MKVYSVGQVNNYIKNIISQDYLLKSIVIKGEVSNCKYHSLGHIYFSLKDETGMLPAVMFRSDTAGLDFRLADGQCVLVSGSIGVYERDGRYQLYAKQIKLDGAGKLFEELERLKYKLNEEGLFDFEHKKPIPAFPKKVGIVTAETGAAIRDIMNIAKRRNPYVQLILYPAKVQGEGAADTIVKGIKVLDAMDVDTIIVGRGGGSIEDLWAFNEEKVVRAIFEATTPIISGTGHEIDTTLADYVADLRAPTPSAACEMAIPDIMTSIRELNQLANALDMRMMNKVKLYRSNIDLYEAKLLRLSPEAKLKEQNQYLSDLYERMKRAIDRKYDDRRHRLEVLVNRLDGLSPTAKLVNGFGYIESEGVSVTTVDKIAKGDKINITISDGIIAANVDEVIKKDGK